MNKTLKVRFRNFKTYNILMMVDFLFIYALCNRLEHLEKILKKVDLFLVGF